MTLHVKRKHLPIPQGLQGPAVSLLRQAVSVSELELLCVVKSADMGAGKYADTVLDNFDNTLVKEIEFLIANMQLARVMCMDIYADI